MGKRKFSIERTGYTRTLKRGLYWCCISYTVNYKKITCDTSVSPDGKYELTLQAVGEPDWPFGSASGRLVLMEGKDKISQTDLELHNDGGKHHGQRLEVKSIMK